LLHREAIQKTMLHPLWFRFADQLYSLLRFGTLSLSWLEPVSLALEARIYVFSSRIGQFWNDRNPGAIVHASNVGRWDGNSDDEVAPCMVHVVPWPAPARWATVPVVSS
jgi:hypothetical protein